MSKFEDVQVFHDGVVGESDKAKRFQFAEGIKQLPKSQIRNERTLRGAKGEVYEITIPRWLAEEEGLV